MGRRFYLYYIQLKIGSRLAAVGSQGAVLLFVFCFKLLFAQLVCAVFDNHRADRLTDMERLSVEGF